ncbi:MAG TPA: hypothetical protein VFA28_21510 [Bryobacteraceae bacterium]|jgi:hypothetical protein|nr:hypothetical protein [Bryobacteraceae bacterium]
MECSRLARGLAVWLDGAGTDGERRNFELHLRECDVCAAGAKEYLRLRRDLRRLPRRAPSPHLRTSLRVIASREQARARNSVTCRQRFKAWREQASFTLGALMRPLALPVAGGLLSAMILFGALMPDFTVELHPVTHDVPTVLFTSASVKDMMPIALDSDTELVVELTVDEQGRMVDYSIVHGQNLLRDERVRRDFENALLAAQFTPATAFGQPTSGKIRVSFRTSTIEVRG